jgi:hypothetical protein
VTLLRTLVALVAIALWAAPASAQTYVAAVLGADLARSYESSSDGVSYPGGDRDALSWALRAGTAFGSRWGVELEFNRGGELESDGSPVFLASQPGRSEWSSLVGLTSATSPSALSLIYPAPTVETEQRTVTWNAIAWVKQPISSRADLVVLAGIGFSHVTQETEFSFTFPPPQVLGIIRAPYTTKSSAYGAGPIVGVETRVRMTDHLELTPGLRVQSLGNALTQGIVIRPSVALGWTF